MPAKSGVGGGIVAVLPGRFGIGVFSPRLDAKGNSVRGIEVFKRLSRDFGFNVFSPGNGPAMAVGRIFTGADAPSRRQPPVELRSLLTNNAHRIKYLCLHGFLAVDSMEFVIRSMQKLAAEADSMILDMHRVEGLSLAAARLLDQARVGFGQDGIAVVFSRIHRRAEITTPLRQVVQPGDAGYLTFEDNDLAAEWCENRLLSNAEKPAQRISNLGEAALFRGLPEPLLQEVETACRTQTFAKDAQILVSGQPSDDQIYFVESGQISILVPLSQGSSQRIATLGPGMVFGEMVLLGQTTRSATVVADTDVTCRVFHASDLERISSREPQLKITLLENLGRDMAGKLHANMQWITALG
jgi:glutaminase